MSTRSSTRTTFQFYFVGLTPSNNFQISSHELLSPPKPNTKSKGSRNVTGSKSKIVRLLNPIFVVQSWSNRTVGTARLRKSHSRLHLSLTNSSRLTKKFEFFHWLTKKMNALQKGNFQSSSHSTLLLALNENK